MQLLVRAFSLPSARDLIFSETDDEPSRSNLDIATRIVIKLFQSRRRFPARKDNLYYRLNQNLLSLLRQFLAGPLSASLMDGKLEETILDELIMSVENGEASLQTSLMEVLLASLKLHQSQDDAVKSSQSPRMISRDTARTPSKLSITVENPDRKPISTSPPPLPSKLLDCLTLGITSPNSRAVLESWVAFIGHCLPLWEASVFQILLPLVGSFCKTLNTVLDDIQATFKRPEKCVVDISDSTIALLLTGLEQSLATAHDRLTNDEVGQTPIKTPEQQQTGFFGNMVSGVFTNDTNRAKTLSANKRLTVLLCFKDAIRVCFFLWSWGDVGGEADNRQSATTASFNYITVRMRNRTRRIFEHLFAAEALECLETLIELWQGFSTNGETAKAEAVLNLLNVIESSRPKNTIPAIFNAIYSRTDPGALEPSRKSTLTSNLHDTSLAAFLIAYTRSLDDDAMDEIWTDCLTFLKDVVGNPMPHRQALPRLLEFISVLGEKVDNTTFGEQKKMRRDLGVG